MKNRLFAVKALIILVVVVAVCMVFSGTVQNILTPKVRIASVKTGKLNRSVSLEGKLQYSDKEDFYYNLGSGETCVITQVYVRAGDHVSQGDLMYSLSYQDPEGKQKTLTEAYREAVEEQLEFERKNGTLRLTAREENYAAAYWALQDAVLEEANAKREAMTRKLTGDDVDESALSEEDREVYTRYKEAEAALEKARKTFQDASRFSMDEEVWAQVVNKKQVEDKVIAAEQALKDFEESKTALARIEAPHDGYIVEVPFKTGDNYDGISALCVMTSANGYPQLACEIEDSSLTIAKGNSLTIETPRGGTEKAKVSNVEMNKDGNRVAVVDLDEDSGVVTGFGSLYTMSTAQITVKLSVEVASNATLLPSSAVHGAEGDRYVYLIHTTQNTVGSKTMTVERMTVNVLAEADGTAAIQEDLSYSQVAYMEDRELSDGSRVMEYLQ